MGLGIPRLRITIMLESNPLKPTMLVGRLGVGTDLALPDLRPLARRRRTPPPHLSLYIYLYICYNTYTYIYIYIHMLYIYIYIHIHMLYIYIYIYICIAWHPYII